MFYLKLMESLKVCPWCEKHTLGLQNHHDRNLTGFLHPESRGLTVMNAAADLSS